MEKLELNTNLNIQTLQKYGTDLTKMAEEVTQILSFVFLFFFFLVVVQAVFLCLFYWSCKVIKACFV